MTARNGRACLTSTRGHYSGREVVKSRVAEVLEGLATVATAELNRAGVFEVPGICRLTKKQRAARKGRNPMTGATIDIPAKMALKARPVGALKTAVIGN